MSFAIQMAYLIETLGKRRSTYDLRKRKDMLRYRMHLLAGLRWRSLTSLLTETIQTWRIWRKRFDNDSRSEWTDWLR